MEWFGALSSTTGKLTDTEQELWNKNTNLSDVTP